MECKDILNLIAIVVIPVAAVYGWTAFTEQSEK